MNIVRSVNIQQQLRNQVNELYSAPLPPTMSERAMYEWKLVESIRHRLNKHHLILRRTADHMNTFYLTNTNDFDHHVTCHLMENDTYQVLIALNEDLYEEQLSHEFNQMIESINMALDTLKIRNALDQETVQRLHIDPTKVQIPYLYFLPDLSKVRYQ
jgi:DNA-binding transcriptional regulator GbsR (MarR family)